MHEAFKAKIGAAAHAVFLADDKPDEEQEALVKALSDLLVVSGALSNGQAAEAWFEPQSREFGQFVDMFHSYNVKNGTGICTRVFFDGRVSHEEI